MKIISKAQGVFYPAEKDILINILDGYERNDKLRGFSKLLIVPHAGYEFSGRTAFKTYEYLDKNIDSITIIAPAIYSKIYGYVSSNADFVQTPVGDVKVLQYGNSVDNTVFERETSIGVQLPMIKYLFPDIPVIPVLYGCESYNTLFEIIDAQYKNNSAVVIVTNLSRFVPLRESLRLDNHLLRKIENKDVQDLDNELADGASGICAAIEFCKKYNYTLIPTLHSNSSEINSDTSNVVGYCGWYLSTQ